MSLGQSRPLFPTANPAGMLMRSFARAKGRIHIVGPHIIRRVGAVLERARASSRTLRDPPLCTRRRGDPAGGGPARRARAHGGGHGRPVFQLARAQGHI